MSAASRIRGIGDRVVTDFSGRLTPHTITERRDHAASQSSIMFRVTPPVPKSSGGWLDADWFEVAPFRGVA